MGFNFWSLVAIICFILRQRITRNIRKPGAAGNFNFCTFTQINGLTGLRFEIRHLRQARNR